MCARALLLLLLVVAVRLAVSVGERESIKPNAMDRYQGASQIKTQVVEGGVFPSVVVAAVAKAKKTSADFLFSFFFIPTPPSPVTDVAVEQSIADRTYFCT